MEFNQNVKEAIAYYVYALVDPRDQKIFYIGKGKDNRVFQHAEAALNENEESLKLNTIRNIIKDGQKVQHYILRHNLTEDEAYLVESSLINMLTYPKFNTKNQLTNLQAGHHQWNEGIKSTEEIETLYDCPKIEVNKGDKLLLVSLNQSYKQEKAKGIYRRPDIYESTRKYWAIGRNRANDIDYVLGVYKGVVRCVIKVNSHEWVILKDNKKPRCCFEGKVCNDSPYLNKDVSDYTFGTGGAIRYIN